MMYISVTLLQVSYGKHIESAAGLHDIVSASGKLGFVDAIDLFITSQNGFPWTDIPKVVVGRRAYDNYLVGTCCPGYLILVEYSYL